MTEGVSWERSVEKARLASLKTFEGRLEIARASFEQIPPNGKGVPRGKSLADFAEEAGLAYDAIDDYRRFARWWGDLRPLPGISWSTAREAMRSKQWKTGADFVAFTINTDPPIYEEDGWEPYQFKAWTVDALRVYLGLEPTATAKLSQRTRREGKEPTADEMHAAAAMDALDTAARESREIPARNPVSRTVARKARETGDEITENAMPLVYDENTAIVHDLNDALDKLISRRVSEARKAADDLIEALKPLEEWLPGNRHTMLDDLDLGQLVVDSLEEDRERVALAYEAALGIDRIQEGLDEILS